MVIYTTQLVMVGVSALRVKIIFKNLLTICFRQHPYCSLTQTYLAKLNGMVNLS